MHALVEDLTHAFLKSYEKDHKRQDVANYPSYYLGPVVFSVADSKNSIIDGQQRITSITLFLIYLNHLQKNNSQKVSIENLIFSETYGDKSFNMTDADRQEILQSLFENGKYELKQNDDETLRNIVDRYNDIDEVFPEELTQDALPYFIDWLIGNVILVKITAYSNENDYNIFETMNDRGMNLTATEMLKGYVLSRIGDPMQRSEINHIWKSNIQKLHQSSANADIDFFQAWFRGKYAESIRSRKANSDNQDYENIGTRLHNWFKNNHERKFDLNQSNDFYRYFKTDFDYLIQAYLYILKNMTEYNDQYPHLFYIKYWGIAGKIRDALLFAPLLISDSEDIRNKKIDAVARFIETFTVRRAINYKNFGSSSIQYTFFNIIKKIRNLSLPELLTTLVKEIASIEESFDGVLHFGLHQQNKKFVKHLLCRISSFIDESIGRGFTYKDYQEPKGKQLEIEHIWSNQFDQHKNEFEQEHEFKKARNSIGALILLPNGTNQSFNSDVYSDKLPHYLKENSYAQSLHPDFYERNPNFSKNKALQQIPFKSHPSFEYKDIQERTRLVQKLCEEIWTDHYYKSLTTLSDDNQQH